MIEKKNIFLIGPMGAGKSTIGRILAKYCGMQFYDSDKEIERKTGFDISRIFEIEGEVGFRKTEEKIILKLIQKKKIILSTGGGSIISPNIRKFLPIFGLVIYLKTNIEDQFQRIKLDNKRPLLFGTALFKKKKLKQLAYIRNPFYKSIANIIIDTNVSNVNYTISKILQILQTRFNFNL